MESKEDFQVFPWSSYQEFKSVANLVLNLEFDSNLLYNADFLRDLQVAERQLVIWRTKTTSAQHLYEIDATHSIVNCLLHEYLPKLVRPVAGCHDFTNKQTNQPKELVDNQPMLTDDCMEDDLDDLNDLNDSNEPNLTKEPANKTVNSLILQDPRFSLINEETIACLYSNAILKFFKMLSYYDVS